jgi:hypothetical protein
VGYIPRIFHSRFFFLVADVNRLANSLGNAVSSAPVPQISSSASDPISVVFSLLKKANILDSESTVGKWVRDRSINWACAAESASRKVPRIAGGTGFVQRHGSGPQHGGQQGTQPGGHRGGGQQH